MCSTRGGYEVSWLNEDAHKSALPGVPVTEPCPHSLLQRSTSLSMNLVHATATPPPLPLGVWCLMYCNKHYVMRGVLVLWEKRIPEHDRYPPKESAQSGHRKSAPFITYSKLRHLHRKSTSEHMIQRDVICIKVPGTYCYASVFSVLSVKWALIQSQIQCTAYISH